MNAKTTFEGHIMKAVRNYFVGTDFYLTMGTLADATENHVYTVSKDMDIDGHQAAHEIASEAWRISKVMAFLSELYYWDTAIEKCPKSE